MGKQEIEVYEGNDNSPLKVYESQTSRSFSSSYKDKWATALYVVHFIPAVAIACAGYARFHSILSQLTAIGTVATPSPITMNNQNSGNFATQFPSGNPTYGQVEGGYQDIVTAVAGIMLACFAVGIGLTIGYFAAMKRWSNNMIKISFAIQIGFSVLAMVLACVEGKVVGIAISAIWLVVISVYFWMIRSKIPFASVLLESVTVVISKYPGTIYTAITAVFAHLVWTVLFVIMLVGSYLLTFNFNMFNPSNYDNSSGANANNGNNATATAVVSIFMIFSFVWTSIIINNLVHVTICGVFATYYFQGQEGSDGKIVVPVRNPTMASAKRALTTSFGTIAFGSLILAVIDTIRGCLGMGGSSKDGASPSYLRACCTCFCGCISKFIEIYNSYAFAQVAIYGKPFCAAAKDTFGLLKSRGLDIVINNGLINGVLIMGAIVIGGITGLVGVGCLAIYTGGMNSPTELWYGAYVFIFAFLIGCSEFHVVAQCVRSGAIATYVCLAEDPQAIKRTRPQLYQSVETTFENVLLTQQVV